MPQHQALVKHPTRMCHRGEGRCRTRHLEWRVDAAAGPVLLSHLPVQLPQPAHQISWSSLREQFGFQQAEGKQGDYQFQKTITQTLREVLQVYPEANVAVTQAGLEFRPSLTHVPFWGLRGLRSSD
jgi:hypothetical protein